MGKLERGEKRQREKSKKHVSFKKRKECILKKTMELAVLCDLQACTVIIDDNGEIATWPENRGEVVKVLEKYREVRVPRRSDNNNGGDGERKEMVPVVTTTPTTTTMSDDDPLEWDQKVLEDLLNEPWEEILNEVGVGVGVGDRDGNNGGDFKNIDDYRSLLGEVDAKLKSLTERIEVLKSDGDYQSIYQQVPIAPPDHVSYMFEGFLNRQSNFYLPNEVILGAEMDSANFDSLMETNEFTKSAQGYQGIQIPVSYFSEYNLDKGGGSSSGYGTQMPIASSPDMPDLFDQDFFLNQQFCPTNWNLGNCGDIF